ncbi:MAG: glycosyltransferase [Frankiaceae bacterium]|nr:glycosyltransferase [Frankiaceae bacterium]MBV9871272.1 glycosyltransferase [Frankiaceae bacterium]
MTSTAIASDLTRATKEPWTILHDFAFTGGGAERVVAALATDSLPGSPVAVLGGSDEAMRDVGFPVHTTTLLSKSLIRPDTYRHLAPALPRMVSNLPPIEGNVLVSSYAFAHHVRCTGKLVVYCHSPLRQVWSGKAMYANSVRPHLQLGLTLSRGYLRRRDRQAARAADHYIATNSIVRDRIFECYGVDASAIIPPPVDTHRFYRSPEKRQDYFLWVGRIAEPYKRLDLAIEAVRGTDHQLVVAGDGRDRARMEAIAPPNVRFVGWQDSDQLRHLYQSAQAVLFTSEDDFGLVPLEAMACGTPTIAFRAGGATISLLENETCIFFGDQSADSLRTAMSQSEQMNWNHDEISRAAGAYDLRSFSARIRDFLDSI